MKKTEPVNLYLKTQLCRCCTHNMYKSANFYFARSLVQRYTSVSIMSCAKDSVGVIKTVANEKLSKWRNFCLSPSFPFTTSRGYFAHFFPMIFPVLSVLRSGFFLVAKKKTKCIAKWLFLAEATAVDSTKIGCFCTQPHLNFHNTTCLLDGVPTIFCAVVFFAGASTTYNSAFNMFKSDMCGGEVKWMKKVW